MSLVTGAMSGDTKHIEKASKAFNINSYKVDVPARTLTSILDEHNVKEIDLFSLDVEGYELNVLQGLDFDKYRPKYMLIECLREQMKVEIEAYISNLYTYVAQLSKYDRLYRCSELD